ncbi:MAG: DUF4279 domain-containing protein [Oscillospiraceae bacterium]|nr:DUF4279 domain-containing protein [Oscillospiraceae bacterium]
MKDDRKPKRVYYHTPHTGCLTYFEIRGVFDPDQVTELLRLAPERIRRIGDRRGDGKKHETAIWRYGSCIEYEKDTAKQMQMTIAALVPKADLLRKIRLMNRVSMTLKVVPMVRFDEPSPSLAPSMQVMRFCLETGTDLKIDLYVSCPDHFTEDSND